MEKATAGGIWKGALLPPISFMVIPVSMTVITLLLISGSRASILTGS